MANVNLIAGTGADGGSSSLNTQGNAAFSIQKVAGGDSLSSTGQKTSGLTNEAFRMREYNASQYADMNADSGDLDKGNFFSAQ